MILFLAGSVYGQINKFYDKVLDLEKELGCTADWVLQTGNFGVYPDPGTVSSPMRARGCSGDFAKLYVNQQGLPRKTLMVAGKHEDHAWLNRKVSANDLQLLPNLTLLLNGYKTHIGEMDEDRTIVGLGKAYSRKTYRYGRGASKRRHGHYTRTEVEKACSQGPTDILLLHEPPKGFGDAEGTDRICYALRPNLVLHNKSTSPNRQSLSTGGILVSLGELDIQAVHWHEKGYDFLPKP